MSTNSNMLHVNTYYASMEWKQRCKNVIFNHQPKHVIYVAIIMDKLWKIHGLPTVFIFICRQIDAWHLHKYMRCSLIFTKMDKVHVTLCLQLIQIAVEVKKILIVFLKAKYQIWAWTSTSVSWDMFHFTKVYEITSIRIKPNER